MPKLVFPRIVALPLRSSSARVAVYVAVMAASCRATLRAGFALENFPILPPPDVAFGLNIFGLAAVYRACG
jgi:hypothetical protein